LIESPPGICSLHPRDISGINAFDRVVLKFRHHGAPVEMIGMNEASQSLVDRLALHGKHGAELPAIAH
jgi:sulfate permease, SulP family